MFLNKFRQVLIIILIIKFCTKCIAGVYKTAPHIIIFMADDLGWNDVGFHGSNQIPTPNIDALGYNGIILNKHYVLPSSTPSRIAFFTGLYPIRMGMQGDGIRGGEPRGLPLDIKILPERLRSLGYTTKLIGKWHIGYHTAQHTPLHRGFDSFLGFYNSHVSYYGYRYSYQNMTGYDMHRGDDPAYGISDKYATNLFTQEAVRIIEHHEISRPLYLQLSHLAVHAPLENPQDYYKDREFNHIRDPNRRKYARMVVELDESVGNVVHALGEKGMLSESLILFITDNGAPSVGRLRNWGSNYPLRGTKNTLYEGGVRGVAVLWSPRLQKSARVSNQLVHITDWLPTLYSVAGGDLKDLGEIDGIDQWNALSLETGKERESLLLNIDYGRKIEGAIYKRFKLLRGPTEHSLYDVYYGDPEKYDKSVELPPYADTIVKSSVSESITYYLGGPVTQPSTIVHLRQEATVTCQLNFSYHLKTSLTACNATQCLYDLENDPCETRNIANQYPRIVKELDDILEKYGRFSINQYRMPIDWRADPRRTNDTWEPWLVPSNSQSATTFTINFLYFIFPITTMLLTNVLYYET